MTTYYTSLFIVSAVALIIGITFVIFSRDITINVIGGIMGCIGIYIGVKGGIIT